MSHKLVVMLEISHRHPWETQFASSAYVELGGDLHDDWNAMKIYDQRDFAEAARQFSDVGSGSTRQLCKGLIVVIGNQVTLTDGT